MESGRPAAIYFWYRQSSAPLISERYRGKDSGGSGGDGERPAANGGGMIGVELDPLGRLIRFEAVPSSGASGAVRPPDWSILFTEAGLDAAAFSPAEPQWLPPTYADARMSGSKATPNDRPAAARRGAPRRRRRSSSSWPDLEQFAPTARRVELTRVTALRPPFSEHHGRRRGADRPPEPAPRPQRPPRGDAPGRLRLRLLHAHLGVSRHTWRHSELALLLLGLASACSSPACAG